MEYRENGTRYKNYKVWENRMYPAYDYESNGLVQHLMSNRIANTDNKILKVILSYFEGSIIFVLKYVDRLKHFKNYHWKNR